MQIGDYGEPKKQICSTNVAFGGPENRTLYITESATGSILTATLEVPGRPMYSHA